jgi:spermidine/putrescine transport system substrate-binding protein
MPMSQLTGTATHPQRVLLEMGAAYLKMQIGATMLFFLASCTVSFADARNLKVMDYDDFIGKEYHAGYFEKYLESPTFIQPIGADQAFDMVVKGAEVDVVYVCSWDLIKWIEAGLIEPWDPARAMRTGFGTQDLHISPQVQALAPYFVPLEFGRMLPIYDSAQVPSRDMESLDVFVNANYKGQVALPADSTLLLGLALLATGVDDWLTVSDVQYSAALEWLRMAHGNQPYYYDDYQVVTGKLARSEVLVAWAWNVVGFSANEYNETISFVHEPTEGTVSYVCGYANVKGPAADSDRVYDFANSVSSADTIEILLQWGDGHPYIEVMRSHLSEDEILDLGLAIPQGPMLFLSGLPLEVQERARVDVAKIRSGY